MLSRTEVVGIGVYGSFYLLFVVVATIAYYLWKMGDVRGGQSSLYSVMTFAVLLQVAASTMAYLLLKIISYFYKSTVTALKPEAMAGLLFRIDWQGVDMGAVNGQFDVATASAILFLKFEMLVYNIAVATGVIIFVFGIAFYAIGSAYREAEHNSMMHAFFSAMAKQSAMIAAVIIHMAIANAFLVGIYEDSAGDIDSRIAYPLKPMPVNLVDRIVWTIAGHA